ncbi:MAG: VOC family protein [Chloroflexi bacterium]|nr:VOC family protein [Chloroflexota bacterium]MYJ58700.1 VOC family protein [Chloroflexota bacterium]
MKPKISIITLGVSDLAASVRFYRDGLGLPAPNYNDGDDICFLELEGTWLSLYRREKFPDEADVPFADPSAGTPTVTLAHNLGSVEAVDAQMQEALDAGATLVKQPEEVFWGGYSGYVSDPDGYLWELAYNPFTNLT